MLLGHDSSLIAADRCCRQSHRRPEQVLTHAPAPNQTMNPLTLASFNELAADTGAAEDSWERSVPVPLPAGGAAFWLPRTLREHPRPSCVRLASQAPAIGPS